MIRLRYEMMRIRHCFDSINTFFAYVVSFDGGFFKIEFFFWKPNQLRFGNYIGKYLTG